MPLVGKNPQYEQINRETTYTAQVFVNRRKVWEGQAADRDTAFQQAKAVEDRYEARGVDASVVVKKSKGR
jgi:hypothetical protein